MLRTLQLIRYSTRRVAATMLAMFVAAAISTSASAQLPEYGWDLRMAEKELFLAHGSDSLWASALTHDNGFTRMWHRNMPALELSNTSDLGMPDIVRFEMTIGDTRFHFSDQHFGVFAPLGTTTPGFNLTSSVADGGDRLVIDISKPDGSGLAVGEVVRFRIQIGVDPGWDFFSFPDFRTVLFHMNGVAMYGPNPDLPPGAEKNAQGIAIFEDGRVVGPATFTDAIVTGPQAEFANGTFPRHSLRQPIDVFRIGARFVIPEPTSGVLAILAVLGGLGLSGRGRRQAKSA